MNLEEIEKYSDFLFYHGEDGKLSIQIILGSDTVWTTQKGMSEIFGVEVPGVSKHISNIFNENELDEESTVSKMEIVRKEGNRQVKRRVEFYNLDMIIAVGYRINSYKATQFRKWSTRILKEYLVKGFVLDDERLKQGNNLFGVDYFKELLERIREIRASEKMFYEKVKELYATSVDYDPKSPDTISFFAKVQNKLEYAVVGQTSAEIIKSRANSLLPNMNLKTWKNVKKNGDIQKADITVAKNYLTKDELSELNTLVNAFLDYGDMQAKRHRLMKMSDWVERIDRFLAFNEYEVLNNAGTVSKDVANKFAEEEYTKYKVIRDRDLENRINLLADEFKSGNSVPDNFQIEKRPPVQKKSFGTAINIIANAGKPPKEK